MFPSGEWPVAKVLKYILAKYHLEYDEQTPMPLEIPDAGRDDLAQWLKELNFTIGVELGVADGIYSEILAKQNPQMRLYGVDPYKPYKGYKDYQRESTFNRLKAEAEKRLSGLPNYKFVYQFGVDALQHFHDDSLSFVFIDANHQEPYISEDIKAWHRKVKPGSIIAGHDYGQPRHDDGSLMHDVQSAVQKFTSEHNIQPWFVLGKDEVKTWLWVKS